MTCSFYILGKMMKETFKKMFHVEKNIRDSLVNFSV